MKEKVASNIILFTTVLKFRSQNKSKGQSSFRFISAALNPSISESWSKRFSHNMLYRGQFLDICNVKQILTTIARSKLLWKSYLVCSDINERCDIRQAFFALVFEVFCIKSNQGVSGFSYRICLIFESSQFGEFSTDLQDSGL